MVCADGSPNAVLTRKPPVLERERGILAIGVANPRTGSTTDTRIAETLGLGGELTLLVGDDPLHVRRAQETCERLLNIP